MIDNEAFLEQSLATDMRQLDRTELSQLIGSIYDCALEPSLWERTLERVAAAIACEQAILSLNDLHDDRALIFQSVGCDADWLRQRAGFLGEIHGALTHWLASTSPPENHPFVASREIPEPIRRQSRYELDCLRPHGIGDVMHCFLVRTPAHFSELVLFCDARHAPLQSPQIETAALLIPHLRRAVVISNVLDVRQLERQQLANTLDELSCSVILTDANARVLYRNKTAARLIDAGQVVAERNGCICLTGRRAASREFREALQRCTGDEADLGAAGVSIRLTDDATPPTFAHVLPLKGAHMRAQLHASAVAALFIREGTISQCDLDRLAKAFGLTPTETQVAAVLLRGATLTDAAAVLGIARTTAKTHLESIFAKTGVTRQTSFIRIALQNM